MKNCGSRLVQREEAENYTEKKDSFTLRKIIIFSHLTALYTSCVSGSTNNFLAPFIIFRISWYIDLFLSFSF